MIKLCNKLLHVLPSTVVSGELLYLLDLVKELTDYNHYVIFEKLDSKMDLDIIWLLQSVGINVLFADTITPEVIEREQASGMILYNIVGHAGIGAVCPSIYYSYGVYDPSPNCTMTIAASEYACTRDCKGNELKLDTSFIIPPSINTRILRYYTKPPSNFTVGLITSGTRDKYPCSFMIELLSKLKGVTLALTTLDKYTHPGLKLAIDEYTKTNKTIQCQLKITAGLYYISRCDVLLYANADKYYEPYNRTVVEAMAFGRPVICENRSCFPTLFEHKNNILLFNMVDEVVDYIDKLKNDSTLYSSIGLNGQLRSSWEDISIHAGKFKKALRMIGV